MERTTKALYKKMREVFTSAEILPSEVASHFPTLLSVANFDTSKVSSALQNLPRDKLLTHKELLIIVRRASKSSNSKSASPSKKKTPNRSSQRSQTSKSPAREVQRRRSITPTRSSVQTRSLKRSKTTTETHWSATSITFDLRYEEFKMRVQGSEVQITSLLTKSDVFECFDKLLEHTRTKPNTEQYQGFVKELQDWILKNPTNIKGGIPKLKYNDFMKVVSHWFIRFNPDFQRILPVRTLDMHTYLLILMTIAKDFMTVATFAPNTATQIQGKLQEYTQLIERILKGISDGKSLKELKLNSGTLQRDLKAVNKFVNSLKSNKSSNVKKFYNEAVDFYKLQYKFLAESSNTARRKTLPNDRSAATERRTPSKIPGNRTPGKTSERSLISNSKVASDKRSKTPTMSERNRSRVATKRTKTPTPGDTNRSKVPTRRNKTPTPSIANRSKSPIQRNKTPTKNGSDISKSTIKRSKTPTQIGQTKGTVSNKRSKTPTLQSRKKSLSSRSVNGKTRTPKRSNTTINRDKTPTKKLTADTHERKITRSKTTVNRDKTPNLQLKNTEEPSQERKSERKRTANIKRKATMSRRKSARKIQTQRSKSIVDNSKSPRSNSGNTPRKSNLANKKMVKEYLTINKLFNHSKKLSAALEKGNIELATNLEQIVLDLRKLLLNTWTENDKGGTYISTIEPYSKPSPNFTLKNLKTEIFMLTKLKQADKTLRGNPANKEELTQQIIKYRDSLAKEWLAQTEVPKTPEKPIENKLQGLTIEEIRSLKEIIGELEKKNQNLNFESSVIFESKSDVTVSVEREANQGIEAEQVPHLHSTFGMIPDSVHNHKDSPRRNSNIDLATINEGEENTNLQTDVKSAGKTNVEFKTERDANAESHRTAEDNIAPNDSSEQKNVEKRNAEFVIQTGDGLAIKNTKNDNIKESNEKRENLQPQVMEKPSNVETEIKSESDKKPIQKLLKMESIRGQINEESKQQKFAMKTQKEETNKEISEGKNDKNQVENNKKAEDASQTHTESERSKKQIIDQNQAVETQEKPAFKTFQVETINNQICHNPPTATGTINKEKTLNSATNKEKTSNSATNKEKILKTETLSNQVNQIGGIQTKLTDVKADEETKREIIEDNQNLQAQEIANANQNLLSTDQYSQAAKEKEKEKTPKSSDTMKNSPRTEEKKDSLSKKTLEFQSITSQFNILSKKFVNNLKNPEKSPSKLTKDIKEEPHTDKIEISKDFEPKISSRSSEKNERIQSAMKKEENNELKASSDKKCFEIVSIRNQVEKRPTKPQEQPQTEEKTHIEITHSKPKREFELQTINNQVDKEPSRESSNKNLVSSQIQTSPVKEPSAFTTDFGQNPINIQSKKTLIETLRKTNNEKHFNQKADTQESTHGKERIIKNKTESNLRKVFRLETIRNQVSQSPKVGNKSSPKNEEPARDKIDFSTKNTLRFNSKDTITPTDRPELPQIHKKVLSKQITLSEAIGNDKITIEPSTKLSKASQEHTKASQAVTHDSKIAGSSEILEEKKTKTTKYYFPTNIESASHKHTAPSNSETRNEKKLLKTTTKTELEIPSNTEKRKKSLGFGNSSHLKITPEQVHRHKVNLKEHHDFNTINLSAKKPMNKLFVQEDPVSIPQNTNLNTNKRSQKIPKNMVFQQNPMDEINIKQVSKPKKRLKIHKSIFEEVSIKQPLITNKTSKNDGNLIYQTELNETNNGIYQDTFEEINMMQSKPSPRANKKMIAHQNTSDDDINTSMKFSIYETPFLEEINHKRIESNFNYKNPKMHRKSIVSLKKKSVANQDGLTIEGSDGLGIKQLISHRKKDDHNKKIASKPKLQVESNNEVGIQSKPMSRSNYRYNLPFKSDSRGMKGQRNIGSGLIDHNSADKNEEKLTGDPIGFVSTQESPLHSTKANKGSEMLSHKSSPVIALTSKKPLNHRKSYAAIKLSSIHDETTPGKLNKVEESQTSLKDSRHEHNVSDRKSRNEEDVDMQNTSRSIYSNKMIDDYERTDHLILKKNVEKPQTKNVDTNINELDKNDNQPELDQSFNSKKNENIETSHKDKSNFQRVSLKELATDHKNNSKTTPIEKDTSSISIPKEESNKKKKPVKNTHRALPVATVSPQNPQKSSHDQPKVQENEHSKLKNTKNDGIDQNKKELFTKANPDTIPAVKDSEANIGETYREFYNIQKNLQTSELLEDIQENQTAKTQHSRGLKHSMTVKEVVSKKTREEKPKRVTIKESGTAELHSEKRLKELIGVYKYIRTERLKNGENLDKVDEMIEQYISLLKDIIPEREVESFVKTAGPQTPPSDFITEQFKFYASTLGHMDLGAFLRFCTDFNIIRKKFGGTYKQFSNELLLSLFDNYSNLREEMDERMFRLVCRRLADCYFDTEYDLIHSTNFGGLSTEAKTKMFFEEIAKRTFKRGRTLAPVKQLIDKNAREKETLMSEGAKQMLAPRIQHMKTSFS